jgi:hypothetical protein
MLGAGVATILAAELKQTLHTKYDQACQNDNLFKMDPEYVKLAQIKSPESISAIAFATPPCMSENIAKAISNDNLCTSLINCFDIVPRFSKVT